MKCYNSRRLRLPSDFPRRARKYDHSTWKCHKWRQFSLFFFPIAVKCLEIEKFCEKAVFISFSFLSRAFRLPDDEFSQVPELELQEAVNILVHNYEGAFGLTACNYNYHHVTSHLKKYREKGPFTEFSAYAFEGTYAMVRRSFTPGTRRLLHPWTFNRYINRH